MALKGSVTSISTNNMQSISKAEYHEFVKSCFIAEPFEQYNLLRVGLELAEEYLELESLEYDLDATREQTLKEIGDIYFWLTWLSAECKFVLCPVLVAPLPDAYFEEPIEHSKAIVGAIKRIYRDGKDADLALLANNLLGSLCISYGVSDTELIECNYAKLADRLKRNVIQGEGDNR